MVVKLKGLNAYVAREILSPFLVSLFILTALLLLGRVMHFADSILARGVGLLDIVSLLGYLLPFILALTIPIALLAGVLFAFGRLSSESELTAMRAAGVSLYQLLPAPLALGAVSYLVCAGITLFFLPWGNTAFKKTITTTLHARALTAVQEGVFSDAIPGLMLYVDTVSRDTGTMGGILIFDARTPTSPMTITARAGRLPSVDAGEALTMTLSDGALHTLAGALYRRVDFATYTLVVPPPPGSGSKDIYDMTLTELRAEAARLRAAGRAPWRPEVEIHERLAVPMACLVFALLGIPLGIRPPRSGRTANAALGIALVLIYYLCLSAGEVLGREGTLPPVLAIWSWNILLAAAALVLLRRADTGRSAIPLLEGILSRVRRRSP